MIGRIALPLASLVLVAGGFGLWLGLRAVPPTETEIINAQAARYVTETDGSLTDCYAVPSGATVLTKDAKNAAKEMGLQMCSVALGDRAAFHRSSAKGETASESEPEGKAAKEIDKLWKWLAKQLKD